MHKNLQLKPFRTRLLAYVHCRSCLYSRLGWKIYGSNVTYFLFQNYKARLKSRREAVYHKSPEATHFEVTRPGLRREFGPKRHPSSFGSEGSKAASSIGAATLDGQ